MHLNWLGTHYEMIITAVALLFALVSFIREVMPPHLTALLMMGLFLATGIISTDEALSVFSNSAPITIAAMFIISAALKYNGIIDQIGLLVLRATQKSNILGIGFFFGSVLSLSAFVNNTPLVIVMTPVAILMAQQMGKAPSKFLIPLSYFAILGGTWTLIGTSTNLLVNGLVITNHLPSFHIFEVSLPGILISIPGIVFMFLFAARLLPSRSLLISEMSEEKTNSRFFSEAIVQPDSEFIGKSLDDLHFPNDDHCFILGIMRDDVDLAENLYVREGNVSRKSKDTTINVLLRQIPLKVYDRLLISSNKENLLKIKELPGILVGVHPPSLDKDGGTSESIVLEGIIGPGSRLINQYISAAWILRGYNCHIWALHRREQVIKEDFSRIPLRFGDVILIEGNSKDLEQLFKNEEILSLNQTRKYPITKKSVLSVLTMVAVVGLSAFNYLPIAGLAILGAIFLIATRCVSFQKAYETIDWRILMLIFGMLTFAIAMENSGLALFLIEKISNSMHFHGPFVLLCSIYLLTMTLTEVMTNNAVAVLITPLVLGLTSQLGLNPKPFLVAIMFAASASFATPIGYQTNTYIYSAGNYRFIDFLKIGIPMNIVMFISAMAVIPHFWAL